MSHLQISNRLILKLPVKADAIKYVMVFLVCYFRWHLANTQCKNTESKFIQHRNNQCFKKGLGQLMIDFSLKS